MQSLFQIEIIYKPAKDETIVFSRSIPIPQKGSDPLNQTKLLFPLIFISLEDDSSIVIPPQPTAPEASAMALLLQYYSLLFFATRLSVCITKNKLMRNL